jgi:hypothetical protein
MPAPVNPWLNGPVGPVGVIRRVWKIDGIHDLTLKVIVVNSLFLKAFVDDQLVDCALMGLLVVPHPHQVDLSWQADYAGYIQRRPWMLGTVPLTEPLKDDELGLPIPDGYFYLTHKAKAAFAWALANDYDYVFRCDTDTFIHIPRLSDANCMCRLPPSRAVWTALT